MTLYYLDNNASGYVMIYGTVQLVNDQKGKEKHWKVAWEDFYPSKPAGFLLIKVSPEWMEVISISRCITGNLVTWQPPIVLFE